MTVMRAQRHFMRLNMRLSLSRMGHWHVSGFSEFLIQQERDLALDSDSELLLRLREIRVKDADVLQETGRP
jgi:hypothetical protein